MAQKDPGGDVIEDIEGENLINLIEESGSMAVYFCKYLIEHSAKNDPIDFFHRKWKIDDNIESLLADQNTKYRLRLW